VNSGYCDHSGFASGAQHGGSKVMWIAATDDDIQTDFDGSTELLAIVVRPFVKEGFGCIASCADCFPPLFIRKDQNNWLDRSDCTPLHSRPQTTIINGTQQLYIALVWMQRHRIHCSDLFELLS
jgi:hypothetical protein